MKPSESELHALATQWETLGIDDDAIVDGRTRTLRPSERPVAREPAETLPKLPSLLSRQDDETIPEIELGERLGAFGEVYLVDWGVAAGFDDDAPDRLPRACDSTGPTGTPQYMAPEMAAAEVDKLGPATDVYLLGATLHEILTGQPPHGGETLYALLTRAFQAKPPKYADEVPDQLAATCQRAMARDPDERFASAEAFRAALADYSRHRESLRLTQEADARLQALSNTVSDTSSAAQQASLYRSFGECRFGFEQALEIDANNDRAREGLQQVSELMAAREREFEALKREQYESDVEISRHTRSIFALVLGLVYGSLSIYRWYVPDTARASGGLSGSFLALLVPGYTTLLWGLTNYVSLGLLAWAWWPRSPGKASA